MSDSTKITVNGVTYDGVEAMPAEVRKVYEQMLAGLPALAAGGTDGSPKILEGHFGPVHYQTIVRKFVVNGTSVDDEASLPADVREVVERAKRMAETGDPHVKKNVSITFRTSSPEFAIHVDSPEGSQSPRGRLPALHPTPAPIEPVSAGGRLVPTLVVGAALAALAVWWWMNRH